MDGCSVMGPVNVPNHVRLGASNACFGKVSLSTQEGTSRASFKNDLSSILFGDTMVLIIE